MIKLNNEQKKKIREVANILTAVEDECLTDAYRTASVMDLLRPLNARVNQAEISRLRHIGARSLHNARIAGSLAQDLLDLIKDE